MKSKAESLGKRIVGALGLDQYHVTEMDFSFKCDQSPDPVVMVKMILTKEQGDGVVEVLKEYELIRRERNHVLK